MIKKILITALLILTPTFAFAVEETIDDLTITQGRSLYLSECIKIAVKNSPELKKAKTKYQIAKTNVNLAKSNYFPTVGAGIGYTQRFNSDDNYESDGYQKRQAPLFGIYLSQLLYDFGKTSSLIQMQRFYEIAAEYEYLDKLYETVNNVKLKYCKAILANAFVEVQEKNVETNKQILDMTENLYKAKKKEKVDYINAQMYYNESLISLEQAKNTKVRAMADLENAMYIAGSPEFEIKTIDTYDFYDAFFNPKFLITPKGEWHNITHRTREKEKGVSDYQHLKFSPEEAYDSALTNSPNLITLDAVINAMDKSVVNIKRQVLPTLKTKVGYDFDNRYKGKYDRTYRNSQFNLSVNLESSINGMNYKNVIDRANLIVESAKSDYETYRQGTYFNVKKYYNDVITAEHQLGISKEKVKKALENLDLVDDNYVAGKANYIELQEARKNVNSAKLGHIKIIYDYNTALANLDRQTNRQLEYIIQYADIPIDLKEIKK